MYVYNDMTTLLNKCHQHNNLCCYPETSLQFLRMSFRRRRQRTTRPDGTTSEVAAEPTRSHVHLQQTDQTDRQTK